MGNINTGGWRIEDFKKAISIAEYLKFRKDLGFRLTRQGKHIKAFIPALDKDGNVMKQGGKIVKNKSILIARIKTRFKNTGETADIDVYWDMNHMEWEKPKTIVDLIKEEVLGVHQGPGDFKQIIGAMKQYINHPSYVPFEETQFDNLVPAKTGTHRSVKELDVEYMYATPKTHDYLRNRGIPYDTLSSPAFMGCYGTHKDLPAFLLTSINNKKRTLQYVDYNSKTKEHSGKYFLSGFPRKGAMHQSNFLPDTNCLAILESPEKSMAHYTLFRQDMNGQKIRPQYLSSCGGFTQNDIQFVKQRAEDKNINRFILSFDNDIAGYHSTVKLFLELNNVDSKKVEVVKTHEPGEYMFRLPLEAQNVVNQQLKNDHRFGVGGTHFLSFIGKPETFFKLLQTDNIRIHQSITKDFLDDLNAGHKLPFRFKDDRNQNLSL